VFSERSFDTFALVHNSCAGGNAHKRDKWPSSPSHGLRYAPQAVPQKLITIFN